MAEFAAHAADTDEVGRTLPLRDARMRLPHLAALARAAGQVTVIVDDRTNQPLAALVPVAVARAAAAGGDVNGRIRELERQVAVAEERARAAVEDARIAREQATVAGGAARAAGEQVRVLRAQVGAARDQARIAGERAAASSAGWARRCETLRADLRRQHGAELSAARRKLARAWAELHRVSPPGADRDVDRLRAAQHDFLDDVA